MNDNLEELYLEDDEDTQKGKFLTFNLGDECYGISIEHVTEIMGIMPITIVPELPDFLKGIINLRGRIIPVMDVRLRFSKEFREYNERTCIVVIEINENNVGLIVDSVAEVTNISDDNIVPPPVINLNASNQYINGIGKANDEVKLLLNCEKLLSVEEINALEQF